jgi:cell division septal protein FtsQ
MPLLRPRVTNRKLRQRRPLRARLPSPRAVRRAMWRGLTAAAPTLFALGVIGVLGTAAGLGYRWLTTSPRFALRDVTVTGNARVAAEEILRRGGVTLGQNVFSLSLHATEAKILQDPWIAEVEIRRRLPDGVAVRIVERQPAALVVVNTAGSYLADATGRVFKRASLTGGEGAGLPAVTGLERKLFGAEPELAAALVRRAIEVATLWRAKERPPLGEVHVGKDGLTLYALAGASPVAVALGRPADTAAALRRFDAAWAGLPAEERAQARTLHLDSRTRPDRATVTLADPGTR